MKTKIRRIAAHSLQLVLLSALAWPALAADDMPMPTISQGRYFAEKDGASLYRAICQACHMPDGQGASGAGAYPPLANNPKLAASGYLVVNVLHGRRGMPGFKYFLSDEQVAAVANYVRTNLGNQYRDPVSAADVAKLRGSAQESFEQ